MELKIVEIETDKIKEYENNAKEHPEWQVKQIAESISKFGFNDPIAINKDHIIIEGHGRYQAALMLKMGKIPCIVLSGMTEAEERAYIIAHNKLTMNTGFDLEKLSYELNSLKIDNIDLGITGFNEDEINLILNKEIKIEVEEEIQEDNFDESKVETICKYGQIYKLGEHKLICGNSFDKDTYKSLLLEIKADLMFCDPPYDMKETLWTNNMEFKKTGSPLLLMAGDKQTLKLCSELIKKGEEFRQFLIHDRENAMLVNTNTPMSQHTIISLFCDHPSKYFVNLNDHFTSIIKCKKTYNSNTEEKMHSKMGKPVPLIASLFQHYCKKDDIILDLFGGGGSSIIACEQIKRKCYSIELDPKQCDIIISRWEQFTGKKAELIC
ncbi:DNA methyltransferase [Fusobacterium ulcerans]|uniref:DNA methyltransferase n=1 Tax=Fusobacterium ulcerans TaxID=861 RepID=UPI00241D1D5B|nr:DNA methyltransferase [Fusobacterium ulcerans]